jgi:hypothetical protein
MNKFNTFSTLTNNNLKKLSRKDKLALVLSQEQINIINACMLGDLHAERRNLKGNTRLQFRYSSISKDYVYHLYNIFKDFTGSKPIQLSSFDNRPNRNKVYESNKFQTFSLPCFNQFREIFYDSNGTKILPKNIMELLTPRGLAYWLADDGYKGTDGIYFCTESFTIIENELLIEALKNKFNLNCGIHKHSNGYRLYIWSNSKELFKNIIKPYLFPSFYYKIQD